MALLLAAALTTYSCIAARRSIDEASFGPIPAASSRSGLLGQKQRAFPNRFHCSLIVQDNLTLHNLTFFRRSHYRASSAGGTNLNEFGTFVSGIYRILLQVFTC
jgi:hypothetical protein